MVLVNLAERFGVGRIDRWYDGGVVLKLIEMGIGQAVRVVKRVDKRRVERAKRQLVYVVAEVEGCGEIS